MWIFVETFFLVFLSWSQLNMAELELQEKYESSPGNDTTINIQDMIANVTQSLEYRLFIKNISKNSFIGPHEMRLPDNVTLLFLYSLSKEYEEYTQLIDDSYWLTEKDVKSVFWHLIKDFYFSEETLQNIFSNYIRYKRTGVIRKETFLHNNYRISVLVEILHLFFNSSGISEEYDMNVNGTKSLKNDKTSFVVEAFLNNSIPLNEDGEINNDMVAKDPNYLQSTLQGNVAVLKGLLNILDLTKNGETALHWASKQGFVYVVSDILSSESIDVNTKNNDGWTPLELAAKGGHTGIVKLLLDKNASINSQDKNGDSPLHWASWEGHVSIVEELLNRNAVVNIQNNYGNTPLSWAAWGGQIRVVRLLLSNNAKIDLKNYYEGWTSLHRAAENGQLAVVKEFISRDHTLANIRDNNYRTSYDVAQEYLHKDVADFLEPITQKHSGGSPDAIRPHFQVELEASGELSDERDVLRKANESILLDMNKSIYNGSVLINVPERYVIDMLRSSQEGDAYAVKFILKHTGSASFQNVNGTSPLHLASKEGHVQVVRELLAYKTAVDIKDNKGWTPLHFAAKKGNLSVVKLLLDNNGTVNIRNNNGDTPLHWAVWNGHLPVVRELLDRKAFLNVQNNFGNTPLNWGSWAGKLDVVKFLLDQNARIDIRTYDEGWSSIHRAAAEGQENVTEEFISRYPCLLYLKDNEENFPYIVASKFGHKQLSDYLSSRMNSSIFNCKVKSYSYDDLRGNFPLHWAALEGNIDSVKMILSQNEKVDRKKMDGNTPLHLASQEGHIEIMEELISFGASVEMKNYDKGRTPLHLAAKNGKLLAVMKLLDEQANVDSKDRNGDSSLHWAAWEGHISVIEELVDRNAFTNIQNSYGNTPLSWASWAGRVDVVKLLLSHNAQIDLKNYYEGWNALHRAAEKGQLAVAKVFLAKNPSLVNIKDNKQRTPYEIAKEYGHKKLAAYLLSLTQDAK